MNYSRRSMLKITAATAAMLAAGLKLDGAEMPNQEKKIPIGLQLYSVRQVAEKDLPAVIQAVGKMGYQGVEFAGYYGWDKKAADLRKLLDDNNLKCCGTHTGLDTLTGDNYKRTVELHKTLGNKFLIVPYLDPSNFKTVEACKKLAATFNDLAAKAKADGMRVGYHAHAGDFKKIEGDATAWDTFFGNTAAEVVMQLDIGNSMDGGGDPYAILKKFPGRAGTIHLKEHGGKPGAPIGEGDVRWNEIFELCEKPGGTEWYIVEHESDPKTPLESVAKCIANLRKMGK